MSSLNHLNSLNRRAGTIVALIALASAAACSRSSSPTLDSGLQADLKAAAGGDVELASHSATSQLVISPLEATPSAVPQRAPHRSPAPASRPATNVASERAPAPHVTVHRAPERVAAEQSAPAPSRSEPAPVAQPIPTPAPAAQPAQRQPGVYKTEGEIFKQMPWIRP
jgi:hypothetical protein